MSKALVFRKLHEGRTFGYLYRALTTPELNSYMEG